MNETTPPPRRAAKLSDVIEERIVTGHYLPGQRLDEREMADTFGVSRTPVREALIQLAAVGLIVMRPRRGAVVAEIGPRQLVEMFEVMAEIEAMCGRLAARRMTEQEQDQLLAAHEACRSAMEAGNADEYYLRNQFFHELIYAGSHNHFLKEQAVNLNRRLRPYRRLQLRVRDRIGASFAEHDAVVRAIAAGEPERAESLLREHIMIQGQRFSDLMTSLSQLSPVAI